MAIVRFAVLPSWKKNGEVPGVRELLDGMVGMGGVVTDAAVYHLVRASADATEAEDCEAGWHEVWGRIWDDEGLAVLVQQHGGVEALAFRVSNPCENAPSSRAAAGALRSLALCQPEIADAVASVLDEAEGLAGPALCNFIFQRGEGAGVEGARDVASGVAAAQAGLRANKSCVNQSKGLKHELRHLAKGVPTGRMSVCDMCLKDLRGDPERWQCSACAWHVCAGCYGE